MRLNGHLPVNIVVAWHNKDGFRPKAGNLGALMEPLPSKSVLP